MGPAARTGLNEETQVDFHALFYTFGLFVGLLVISGAMRNSVPMSWKSNCQFACKYTISVRYNGNSEPMKLEDIVQEQPGDTSHGKGVPQWKEVGELRKLINHNQDSISRT